MSDHFELVRVAVDEAGAFGVLSDSGIPFAVTLERTFGDKIIVPPGEYLCPRTRFHGGNYATYEVPVPGHDRVLFHIGNLEEDSMGCILVGLQFGFLHGKPGVLLSRLGFRAFMQRAGNHPKVHLRVLEAT